MLATNFRPIFSLLRNGYAENTIHGEVFIRSGGVTLNQSLAGDNLQNTFCPRSVLKPWQTRYLLQKIRSKSEDAFQRLVSSSYLPLCFASHSGQVVHERHWKQAASELGILPEELGCPNTYPRDRSRAKELQDAGLPPSSDLHQCSGKHLLFVYACKLLTMDPRGYVSLDHPIHREMHAYMQTWVNEPIQILQDGCGLPNYVVSCQLFLEASDRLARSAQIHGSMEFSLFQSWKNSPRLVGGARRLDSDITEETGGTFFAKEGADGLLWLQSLSDDPVTVLVKLGFGYKERYLAYAVFTELLRLKNSGGLEHPDLQRLYGYLGFWIQNKLEDNQQLGLAGS